MGKRSKRSKKRSERRERAKGREEGLLPEDELIESDATEEEASEQAAEAAPPPKPEAREKKAAKAPREEETDNAWERLKAFLREVQIEAKKINWPAIDETWKSTWVTVIFIVVLAIFMGIASAGFAKITAKLFGLQTISQRTDLPVGDAPPTTPLGSVDLSGGAEQPEGDGASE